MPRLPYDQGPHLEELDQTGEARDLTDLCAGSPVLLLTGQPITLDDLNDALNSHNQP